MGGEKQEITVQVPYPGKLPPHGLGGVHRHGAARQAAAGDDLLQGIRRTQHVGHGAEGQELGLPGQEAVQGGQVQFSFLGDGHQGEFRPGPAAGLPPGQQVGVVLHLRGQHQVPGPQLRQGEGIRQEIGGIRGPVGEDDLVPVRRPEEFRADLTGLLQGPPGLPAQAVRSPVGVGAHALPIILQRPLYGSGALGSGGVVQIDHGASVTFRLLQHGEIPFPHQGVPISHSFVPPAPLEICSWF